MLGRCSYFRSIFALDTVSCLFFASMVVSEVYIGYAYVEFDLVKAEFKMSRKAIYFKLLEHFSCVKFSLSKCSAMLIHFSLMIVFGCPLLPSPLLFGKVKLTRTTKGKPINISIIQGMFSSSSPISPNPNFNHGSKHQEEAKNNQELILISFQRQHNCEL
ncbi:hypothetical protein H5410_011805 [Solanum commersonii]|uniref:Uncharacterized protein n=1 Tax=Solanum commersonii TaxID=4109 RepID=A0A9J6AQP7_SOLCO|nr:hypothetical protein H5410_011805 [Solanum commersonii]